MTTTPENPHILLVDDGELSGVARVLDEQGIAYSRLRGGQIPREVAPPRDLLIVTPRRVERVRRGSPADAVAGRPLRIIGVAEDSPAMRRRLRRDGLHLLIRLPAEPEIWRLLVARALYRGSERRDDPRVAVGSPVSIGASQAGDSAVLIDLSNRGCRLQTMEPLSVEDPIEFTIPASCAPWNAQGPLTLRGRVRRLIREPGTGRWLLAILFDADLPESSRTRLTALINHWASGLRSLDSAAMAGVPPIPSCQLPSLPDLTLDDETDPPVLAKSNIEVKLGGRTVAAPPLEADPRDRRQHTRARFSSSVVAKTPEGPFVLIGRDLSASGMRIERHPDLHVGDRFQLALHGPFPDAPTVVDAQVVRDDGMAGFGLLFDGLEADSAQALEKMVACLPDVESLEDGEVAGLGAVLSEIVFE